MELIVKFETETPEELYDCISREFGGLYDTIEKCEPRAIQVQARVSPMLAEENKVDCNNCYECLKDKTDGHGLPIPLTRMILCPICGNKRCPKATDHNLECTNSNESGQAGSRY